jgi:hypothetical protein
MTTKLPQADAEFDATLLLITGPSEEDVERVIIPAGEDGHEAARLDALLQAIDRVQDLTAETGLLRYVDESGDERVLVIRLAPNSDYATVRNVPGEDVPA